MKFFLLFWLACIFYYICQETHFIIKQLRTVTAPSHLRSVAEMGTLGQNAVVDTLSFWSVPLKHFGEEDEGRKIQYLARRKRSRLAEGILGACTHFSKQSYCRVLFELNPDSTEHKDTQRKNTINQRTQKQTGQLTINFAFSACICLNLSANYTSL